MSSVYDCVVEFDGVHKTHIIHSLISLDPENSKLAPHVQPNLS